VLIRYISEMVQANTIVTMNMNMKSIELCHFQWLLVQVLRSWYFSKADASKYLIITRTVVWYRQKLWVRS